MNKGAPEFRDGARGVSLSLAVLGPRCCTAFSLVAVSGGGLLAAVRRLVTVAASFAVEHMSSGVHRPQSLQHVGSGVTAPRLRSTGSVVVAYGLSCSMARGIFWTRDQTSISCNGK